MQKGAVKKQEFLLLIFTAPFFALRMQDGAHHSGAAKAYAAEYQVSLMPYIICRRVPTTTVLP